ncbi:MAG: RluA family pseudouridine synthase [Bacteroidales bacterium]|nr:RluA family pseudouridine synthase [Bacteroidales bacterium]
MNILFEDNHIIAVNKGSSDLVQGDKTGDIALDAQLKLYLKEKYAKPGNVFIGVAHRIDRPVSGVVLFAKTSKALARLNKMFSMGEVKKAYWAIVKNKPEKESGTLHHYLLRNEKQNKSYCYDTPGTNSKEAILEYRLLAKSDMYYLLEVDLKTGRHHQIRAQLASMNCPIRGDLKYGYPRSNDNGGISLHARRIEFIHPVKNEPLKIIAPVPSGDKLWQYFEATQV